MRVHISDMMVSRKFQCCCIQATCLVSRLPASLSENCLPKLDSNSLLLRSSKMERRGTAS